VALAAFVVGVAIGVGGAPLSSSSTPSPTNIASITQAPAQTSAPTQQSAASPTLEPTPPPPTPPPAPVVVKGSGSQKTQPFDMADGDFTVTITGSGRGNVIAHLVPGGGDILSEESLFNEIANGKYTYETVVYGLAAGSYYLDMTNDGAWTVTFTPLA
jgi:hypothetical protein